MQYSIDLAMPSLEPLPLLLNPLTHKHFALGATPIMPRSLFWAHIIPTQCVWCPCLSSIDSFGIKLLPAIALSPISICVGSPVSMTPIVMPSPWVSFHHFGTFKSAIFHPIVWVKVLY